MAELAYCFARCTDTKKQQDQNCHDTVDAGPQREHLPGEKHSSKVAWYDDVFLAYCTIMYIADVTTDLLVSAKYFRSGDYIWFSLTLFCIIGASIVMNVFSLKWFYDDIDEHVGKTKTIVVHIFQLGPLQRYWDAYKNGRKTRTRENSSEYYDMYIEQWRDITMLRLFEAFIESAPQLILQLYILAYKRDFDKESDWLTALSACISLFSLSTSIVSYSKALRDARINKGKMTWWAFICQCVWRLSMVASRIITLVLFASVYRSWILLVIGFHWVAMAIWVQHQQASFCGGKKHLERFFSAIIGFVYIFCFFNTKDGFTRRRLIIFYIVIFIEDCILMGLWLPYRHEYGVVFFIAVAWVFGGFFLGAIAMFLYYQFYHPSLATQGIICRTNHDVPRIDEIVYVQYFCCCHLRYHRDDLSEPSNGNKLVVDFPVSQGSVGQSLSRSRESSPPFEREVFYHKPSELQRRHSLEKLRRKQLQAERKQKTDHAENGVSNGVCSANGLSKSEDFELMETRPAVNGFNSAMHGQQNMRMDETKLHGNAINGVCSPGAHTSKDYNFVNIETRPDAKSGQQDMNAPDNTKVYVNENGSPCGINVLYETSLSSEREYYENETGTPIENKSGTCNPIQVKADGTLVKSDKTDNRKGTQTSAADGRSSNCNYGAHCRRHDDEGSTTNAEAKTKICDDGLHCGTDDEDESAAVKTNISRNGMNSRMDDVMQSRTGTCDDGLHCGTDDEEEARTGAVKTKICSDGLNIYRTDKTKTREAKTKICEDGLHCGTDDEEETETGAVTTKITSNGLNCGTDDHKEARICSTQSNVTDCGNSTREAKTKICEDGLHCGTDDEEETETGAVKTKITSNGLNCGTDDHKEAIICSTQSNYVTDCGNSTREAKTKICDDGLNCGTDDEEESKTKSVKSKHSCNRTECGTRTTEANTSNIFCDRDGSHCDTPVACQTKNDKCKDGVHCGTDDEDESRQNSVIKAKGSHHGPGKKTNMLSDTINTSGSTIPSPPDIQHEFILDSTKNMLGSSSRLKTEIAFPEHLVDENNIEQNGESVSHLDVPNRFSLGFNHRYSIVSDCISLSSSSSDMTEDLECSGHTDERQTTTTSCKDDSDEDITNNNLLLAGTSSPNKQSSPHGRNKNANRISFPNFVASNHLNRGKFSSLRVSREDLKTEKHAGEDGVDNNKSSKSKNMYWKFLLQSLTPRKFGSVRERMQDLGRSQTRGSSTKTDKDIPNSCVRVQDSKGAEGTSWSGGVKGSTI